MLERAWLNIVKSNIISLFSIDNMASSRAELWHFRFIFAVFVFFLTFVYRISIYKRDSKTLNAVNFNNQKFSKNE